MSFITAHGALGFIGSGDILRIFKIQENSMAKEFFNWDQIKPELIKKPDFEEEKALKSVEKRQILCIGHSNVSNGRRLLAVGTNEKQIHVIEYTVDENDTFLNSTHVITAIVPKAPTALTFDREDAYIIVGDRAGDVHRFSVTEGRAVELAGAISMVLDVGFTPNGRQLLMTDRDEKLRVIRYPETYVIDAYCLGHTEYVKTLACQSNDHVWTAGGDKIIKNWKIWEGSKSHDDVDLSEYQKPIRRIAYNSEFEKLAVILEGSDSFLTVDVKSEKPEISVHQFPQEELYLDVVVAGNNFVVLGRSSITVLNAADGSTRQVEIDEKLAESLKNTEDAAEKFEKIEAKKMKV